MALTVYEREMRAKPQTADTRHQTPDRTADRRL